MNPSIPAVYFQVERRFRLRTWESMADVVKDQQFARRTLNHVSPTSSPLVLLQAPLFQRTAFRSLGFHFSCIIGVGLVGSAMKETKRKGAAISLSFIFVSPGQAVRDGAYL
jgi:hypothetical protein